MQAQMPDDYRIPAKDAAYLRTCLGMRTKIGETPRELPDAVGRAHFDMARALSRLGATGNGMDATQLAVVVVLALREGVETIEEQPQYVFPGTDYGHKVVIHWRNKDRAAHFLKMYDDRVIVLHEGNERNIRPDLVRFPEAGEFPDVADSINGD
jgi:hypothetical protein